MRSKSILFRSQDGAVEILFAAVAFGLFIFLALFAVDSYLVSQGSFQLRSALDKACNEAASDGVVSKRLDADGRFLRLLNARLEGTNLDLQNARLFIPGMPENFTLGNVGGVLPNFPSGNVPVPGVEFNSGTFVNNVNNFPSAPPEGFPAASFDGYYDAGSFVGCYAEATIRTLWWRPEGLERTVSAKFAYASGIRGVDPRVVNANDDYPAIVVGIAPQIGTLPVSGIPALDGSNTYIFNSALLNSGTHDSLTSSLVGKTGSGPYLAWPLLVDNTLNDEVVRQGLYAACASAPVVLRQRASSALLELLSRHGATRTSTSVLIANPYRAGTFGYGALPIESVSVNEDLRSTTYRLPVLSAVHDGVSTFDPLLSPDRSPSDIEAEYSSLLSRMPSLCYHIDTTTVERLKRLRVSSYPLNYVVNFGYEGGNFSANPKSGEQFIAAPPDYFDLLGYWSTPGGGQRLMKAPFLASILGSQALCPYIMGNGGNVYCTADPLEPDVVGIINAWKSAAGSNTVYASPGLGAPSTPSFAVSNRRRALVVFTHELTQTQWSQVGALLPALGTSGPVTIIYIPTSTPGMGGFDSQISDIVTRLGADKTRVCRPSYQQDPNIEGNVLIPIVPAAMDDGMGNKINALPNFPCVFDHFKCMADSENLDDLWNCLLSEDETSIDSMMKEQVFLSFDRSPIMELYRKF